ncbi:DUF4097 family beta strand repeat-containing protein [Nostoc sp. LPT]|uniref:DUF4097 family beta strand repeat-containing protein n=1 Tax=Nostoc sp. LPT TaxID=2815387 RepID=UPI001DDF8908|nr:DUF4097 family beta strand repeat-containing protein [Nostoc sp. LPT]MBN4004168.1 hypothetical protein [Nostoc sp. LPT]
MGSVKRFLPIVMFSFSFFTAFILLGVLVNNSLTDEVQLFEGILISVISSLSFVAGKWFVSKIETGDYLSDKMDDNLAQSVLNLWIITGAAALYISFNAHRNLEDFVLLEVIVFSLIIWKTSTKQLKLTDNDLKRIKSELEVTESKLKANEDELEATKSKLQAAEAELKTSETELKATKSKLKAAEAELKTTDSNLKTTKIELKTIESNLKATEAELNAAKEQLKEASFDKEYSL